MKKLGALLFVVAFCNATYSQNALVIQNNAFVVINGGTAGNEAVLVINQTNANGIITSGGGNIITQGEFDYIKWNVQTGTGNYVIPFTTDVGLVKIPLQINITSAGTGSGYLALSSWDVATGVGVAAYNNTPYPSEVTHMAGANGQADVSEYVVDRFWIMDVNDPLGVGQTFGTEPIATYNFGYNTAAAETAGGNILAVGNLGAQRYNGATNKWHGWFSGTPAVANAIWGTDNAAGNVSGVAPVGPWYRTWTLADISEPLPVTMTSMDAECEENGVVINWETASELNNDHFEIYKSYDGIDFNLLATIPATGNANSITQYQYVDELGSSNTSFYKIAQVDVDRTQKFYDPIKMSPCFSENSFNVYSSYPGEVTIDLTAEFDEEFNVIIYDALGKQVSTMEVINTVEGPNKFIIPYTELAFGNYLVTLQNNAKTLTKKLTLK